MTYTIDAAKVALENNGFEAVPTQEGAALLFRGGDRELAEDIIEAVAPDLSDEVHECHNGAAYAYAAEHIPADERGDWLIVSFE